MKSLNVGSTKMGVACGLQVSTRVVCSRAFLTSRFLFLKSELCAVVFAVTGTDRVSSSYCFINVY